MPQTIQAMSPRMEIVRRRQERYKTFQIEDQHTPFNPSPYAVAARQGWWYGFYGPLTIEIHMARFGGDEAFCLLVWDQTPDVEGRAFWGAVENSVPTFLRKASGVLETACLVAANRRYEIPRLDRATLTQAREVMLRITGRHYDHA